MHDLQLRHARAASAEVAPPRAFLLIGPGGANVVDSGFGQAPIVVDAEGVVLRSGAVFAWCRTGCCDQLPRRWPSVDAVADFHGSWIVDADGTVRAPGDVAAGDVAAGLEDM